MACDSQTHVTCAPECVAANRPINTSQTYTHLQFTPSDLPLTLYVHACTGKPWGARAGATACAHLLQQAMTNAAQSPASQADSRAVMSAMKMCWAWCLQQAACDVLPLQDRSLDVECMEQAAYVVMPRAAGDWLQLRDGDAASKLPTAIAVLQHVDSEQKHTGLSHVWEEP